MLIQDKRVKALYSDKCPRMLTKPREMDGSLGFHLSVKRMDYRDSTYVDPIFLFSDGYSLDIDPSVCPSSSGLSSRSQLCS